MTKQEQSGFHPCLFKHCLVLLLLVTISITTFYCSQPWISIPYSSLELFYFEPVCLHFLSWHLFRSKQNLPQPKRKFYFNKLVYQCDLHPCPWGCGIAQGLLTPRWLWLQRSGQRGAGFRAIHWQWLAGTAGWALETWPRWNGWQPTGPGPGGKEILQQNKKPLWFQNKLYESKITAASIHYLKSCHPNRKTLKCDTQDKCASIQRIFDHGHNPVYSLRYFKE